MLRSWRVKIKAGSELKSILYFYFADYSQNKHLLTNVKHFPQILALTPHLFAR